MTLSMHLTSIDLKATRWKSSKFLAPTFLGRGRINGNIHILDTICKSNKNLNYFVNGSVNSFAQAFKTWPLRPFGPIALHGLYNTPEAHSNLFAC